MIKCSSSKTSLVFGEICNAPAPVKKTKVPADISHVAADNVVFQESSEIEAFRPSKVQATCEKFTSKIEFGASENEVIPVKKVQVSDNLAHVAATQVAFGDRNVPTPADKFRATKGQVVNHVVADSSIEFGKADELPSPASPSKTGLQIVFEETQQDMVPVASTAKSAKSMAATPSKGAMADVLVFQEEQTVSAPVSNGRMPVGGATSISFGDAYTPAKPVVKAPTSDIFNVLSPTPVEVKHTSKSFQSSAFTAAPDGEQPIKSKPSKKIVYTEIKDVDEKFGKMKTDLSNKRCEIFTPMSEEPRPRSAKKTIHPQSSSIFGFGPDTTAPVTGSIDRLQPTVPSSKAIRNPVVGSSHAAGAKPRPLEPECKSRGPVGGSTSVIFG